MVRENGLGYKICFENMDLALEDNTSRDRKNIVIFICVNDITQTTLGEKLGFNRSAVSVKLFANSKLKRHASEFSIFRYKREDKYNSKFLADRK